MENNGLGGDCGRKVCLSFGGCRLVIDLTHFLLVWRLFTRFTCYWWGFSLRRLGTRSCVASIQTFQVGLVLMVVTIKLRKLIVKSSF